jgi:hypothetical protein
MLLIACLNRGEHRLAEDLGLQLLGVQALQIPGVGTAPGPWLRRRSLQRGAVDRLDRGAEPLAGTGEELDAQAGDDPDGDVYAAAAWLARSGLSAAAQASSWPNRTAAMSWCNGAGLNAVKFSKSVNSEKDKC